MQLKTGRRIFKTCCQPGGEQCHSLRNFPTHGRAARISRLHPPIFFSGRKHMVARHRIAVAALAAAGALVSAFGADAVSKKDQEFFTKAAGGGMFEVEVGKLAETRSTDPQVKSFGSMLVKD